MESEIVNNFFFEETVTLNLGFVEDKQYFFCNGFLPLTIINVLPYYDNFQLTDFFLEFGMKEDYKCLAYKDVEKITDFNSFKKLLNSFEEKVFIFRLSFSLGFIELMVDDNKEISFSFEKKYFEEAKKMLIGLMVKFFNFSQTKSEEIFSLSEHNLGNYLEINEQGEIIRIAKDFLPNGEGSVE